MQLFIIFTQSFKKFITKSIMISFSFGFDSAISKVNAVKVLLSIVCFSFLYNLKMKLFYNILEYNI